jgi:hypothetical protein
MAKIIETSIGARPSYRLGEPIVITFSFKNVSENNLYILPWNTPMDDYLTDCIVVKRGKKKIPYDGILVKRGHPHQEDYLSLEAGKSVDKSFDITREFNISELGDYSITVDTRIADVVINDAASSKKQLLDNKTHSFKNTKIGKTTQKFEVIRGSTPRKTIAEIEREKERSIRSERLENKTIVEPPPPGFVGGNGQQQLETVEAHKKAIKSIEICLKNLDQSPTGSPDYIVWFGKSVSIRFEKIVKHFRDIHHVQLNEEITYNLTGNGCKPSWYAYTYKGSRTIWLCTGFWNTNNSDIFDSRYGTIIHEFSHAVCDTEDLIYSTAACELLAINDPGKAIINADNHEYFAETIAMK